MEDIAKWLVKKVQETGQMVDRLAFIGHGGIGCQEIKGEGGKNKANRNSIAGISSLDFNNLGNTVTVEGVKHSISNLFAADASIEFYGCSVALGMGGRNFLRTVANHWLNARGGSAMGYEGTLVTWRTLWMTWWTSELDRDREYHEQDEANNWLKFWSDLYENTMHWNVNWIKVTVSAGSQLKYEEKDGTNKSEGVTIAEMP